MVTCSIKHWEEVSSKTLLLLVGAAAAECFSSRTASRPAPPSCFTTSSSGLSLLLTPPPHSSSLPPLRILSLTTIAFYGCNLAVQRDNKRFVFLDMLTFECPDGDGGGTFEGGLVELYGKIQKAVEVSIVNGGSRSISIMIDDISLLEVAAKGSSNHVLDFLHYCHTLTTEIGCSLAVLNHEDIYSRMERPNLILQMEYLAEVIIKVEPLATGLATDVHGQLTVMNKRNFDGPLRKKSNFHFRVKENNVEYFYPGSRT
ncbi:elongator complex protein 6 isoform X2 [Rhododendron vialii]|uniref:elongator complex protein 6 isoform X2 n=1 Tax=Rhododendron vialii TaxID=182163 RepID=UPI00265FF255|nr:elongator complex protein 6 isoform X2 [Rhododendron vialii]